MLAEPRYEVTEAVDPSSGDARYVIVDQDLNFHAATGSLDEMAGRNLSPNTIKEYGRRVAWYLSWIVLSAKWLSVGLSRLVMWRNTLATTPITLTSGQTRPRKPGTVRAWMTALYSFYRWADRQQLLTTDLVSKITDLKFIPPGKPGAGESGVYREVLVPELRVGDDSRAGLPDWIDNTEAREKLAYLELNLGDRFFIDSLCATGIRVGEALSLCEEDMHLGGGHPDLNCNIVEPHFHVVMGNPTENGARAKGRARTIWVHPELASVYASYLRERFDTLGDSDRSQHVFVNLYCQPAYLGQAMSKSGVQELFERVSRDIDFDITGPHMLRHTFATTRTHGIGCDKVDPKVLSEILGHGSYASTAVYTHYHEEAMKRAAAAMPLRQIDFLKDAAL